MDNIKKLAFLMHSKKASFLNKVKYSTELIETALSQCNNPYIAYSGGKDSSCIAQLVWSVDPSIKAVYFDADAAYPGTESIIEMLQNAGKTIIKWEVEPIIATFKRMGGISVKGIERETMKTTVYRPIQEIKREYGFDLSFVGLRAEESRERKIVAHKYGDLYHHKGNDLQHCQPVIWWKYEDVWAYIVSNNIPYNSEYDLMWDMPRDDQRISYWAGETKRTHGRWVWLRRNHPELYAILQIEFPDEVGQYV